MMIFCWMLFGVQLKRLLGRSEYCLNMDGFNRTNDSRLDRRANNMDNRIGIGICFSKIHRISSIRLSGICRE